MVHHASKTQSNPAKLQSSRGLGEVIKPVYTGISYVLVAQILLSMMILAVLGDINGTDPKVRQEDC